MQQPALLEFEVPGTKAHALMWEFSSNIKLALQQARPEEQSHLPHARQVMLHGDCGIAHDTIARACAFIFGPKAQRNAIAALPTVVSVLKHYALPNELQAMILKLVFGERPFFKPATLPTIFWLPKLQVKQVKGVPFNPNDGRHSRPLFCTLPWRDAFSSALRKHPDGCFRQSLLRRVDAFETRTLRNGFKITFIGEDLPPLHGIVIAAKRVIGRAIDDYFAVVQKQRAHLANAIELQRSRGTIIHTIGEKQYVYSTAEAEHVLQGYDIIYQKHRAVRYSVAEHSTTGLSGSKEVILSAGLASTCPVIEKEVCARAKELLKTTRFQMKTACHTPVISTLTFMDVDAVARQQMRLPPLLLMSDFTQIPLKIRVTGNHEAFEMNVSPHTCVAVMRALVNQTLASMHLPYVVHMQLQVAPQACVVPLDTDMISVIIPDPRERGFAPLTPSRSMPMFQERYPRLVGICSQTAMVYFTCVGVGKNRRTVLRRPKLRWHAL